MSSPKEERNQQLGMNISTAQYILRKSIMFKLVQQCKLDICYQCNRKIESIDDFSIEHKDPWLHSNDPVGKFFDLDNIAFSHTVCNYGNTRRSVPKPRKVTESLTGYKGVHYHPRKAKSYRGRIYHKNKAISLGYFETAREAAEAYDKAALELHGSDAVTNRSLGLL